MFVPVFSQDDSLLSRIAIAPFSNKSADPTLDAVSQTVTDTIALTLKLLGRFTVSEVDAPGAAQDAESAASLAESHKLDSVVFGSVNRDPSGAFVLAAQLFDRRSGTFTITQTATAASALDVFGAADGLVKGFLEALSGSHIGFGSVALENSGEPGSYEVYVDGAIAGQNLTSIPKVLNGHHLVTVTQKRLLGEFEVARLDTAIAEDDTVTLRFSIPYLTDPEKAKLDGLFAAAKEGIDVPDSAASSAALSELDSILSDVPWSPRVKELKTELDRIKLLSQVMSVRFAVEKDPLKPSPDTLLPLRALLAQADVNGSTGSAEPTDASVANGEELRAIATETANIETVLLEYEAAKEAGAREWGKVAEAYDEMGKVLDLADPRVAAYYRDRSARFARAFAAYQNGAIHGTPNEPYPEKAFRRYMGDFFKASSESRRRFSDGLSSSPGDLVLLSPDMAMAFSVNGVGGSSFPLFVDPGATKELSLSMGKPRDGMAPIKVSLPPPRWKMLSFINPWDYPQWMPPTVAQKEKPNATAPLFHFGLGGLVTLLNPTGQSAIEFNDSASSTYFCFGGMAGAYVKVGKSLYIGPELFLWKSKSSDQFGDIYFTAIIGHDTAPVRFILGLFSPHIFNGAGPDLLIEGGASIGKAKLTVGLCLYSVVPALSMRYVGLSLGLLL
jgi:TolB-like protein